MKTLIAFIAGVVLGAMYAPFIKPTLIRVWNAAKEGWNRGA